MLNDVLRDCLQMKIIILSRVVLPFLYVAFALHSGYGESKIGTRLHDRCNLASQFSPSLGAQMHDG